MRVVKQSCETKLHCFLLRYATLYAVIDAREIFVKTLTDLHMQSST